LEVGVFDEPAEISDFVASVVEGWGVFVDAEVGTVVGLLEVADVEAGVGGDGCAALALEGEEGLGCGACAGDFDVGDDSGGSAKEEFEVVFGVAGCGDEAGVCPDVGGGWADEFERPVDDVGSPVEELAAAELAKGLPVVPGHVVADADLDGVEGACQAAVDGVADGEEGGVEAAVEADEQLAGG